MMRPLFAAFSRYRPRALTVLLLAAIAAMIMLANSSEELGPRNIDQATFLPESDLRFDVSEPIAGTSAGPLNVSYGWPLLWRQDVVVLAVGIAVGGPAYSPSRLAGDVAIWIVLLALPAGACEWLLRRYRPRFRFSLRSMLIVVALTAALCSWFAVASNRARTQDALIAVPGGNFWGDRWGPKWLEVIGADRYCRRIVGVAFNEGVAGDRHKTQQTFDQLRRLPDLEYLSLDVDTLSPELIDGLGELRQLRTLRIEMKFLSFGMGRLLARALGKLPRLRVLSIQSHAYQSYGGPSRKLPTPEGALEQLERLNLGGRTIACEDLACLAGLKNLKSLALRGLFGKRSPLDDDRSLLANLPERTHFESLDLSGSRIFDDLQHVAAIQQLKSLRLVETDFSAAALAQLARLESLEELAIDDDLLSSRECEVILKLKRLKKLHLGSVVEESLMKSSKELRDEALGQFEEVDDEYADWLRGLATLRESKAELVIDGNISFRDWSMQDLAPNRDKIPDWSFWIRKAVRAWKEQQAAQAAISGAAAPPPAARGLGN